MNFYNQNLLHLLDKRKISLTEFENIIYIPKVTIMEPTPDEMIRIADYFEIPIDVLIKKDIKNLERIKENKIQLLILDVDGTLTDGGMYYSENGDHYKKYNTKDGMGISLLTKSNFKVGIISHGYKPKVVEERAQLLGIQHIYVGRENKLEILKTWCTELKIDLKNVAFIGDDINDLEVINNVGLSACPIDAVNEVKSKVDVILSLKGGEGCVREFIDNYIRI